MTDDNARLSPVVAVDLDGVLRVAKPDRGALPEDGVFRKRITVERAGYPDYLHREPDWNEEDEWTSYHWLSGVGAEWIRSLLDRGIHVVWATTWRWTANKYFAKPLGLPDLPVATEARGPDYWTGSFWKAMEMSDRFLGRPLLWVDDQVGPEALEILERDRRPVHPGLTHWHWVRGEVGITHDDVVQMEEWLALASSSAGQDKLRRQRDERDARRRRVAFERYGVLRDDLWFTIHWRLLLAIGPNEIITELLADLAVTYPNEVDPAEVDKLVAWRGSPHTPPTTTLLSLMRVFPSDELAT